MMLNCVQRKRRGRPRTVAIALIALALLVGCNTLSRQPKMRDAAVTPAQLKPGDSAVITVKVADRHHVVDRVIGVVQEDPRVEFTLKDDGTPPDHKANDGVWTLPVDVPFMAPPGDFTLVFTAYNSRGDVVMVRMPKKAEAPLTATCKVVIQYPQEQKQP